MSITWTLTDVFIIQPEESSATDKKADGFWRDQSWVVIKNQYVLEKNIHARNLHFFVWHIYRINNLCESFKDYLISSTLQYFGVGGRKMKKNGLIDIFITD